MKKLMIAALMLGVLVGCSTPSTLLTPSGVEVSASSLPKEEAQKLAKMQDSLYHERAANVLKNSSFVLEADRLIHDHGRSQTVSSMTNFIMVSGEKVVIQVAPFVGGGPNGVGGITVDGHTSNVKISTDKHGGVTYTMDAIGAGLSANVVVKLTGGSDYATAQVKSNFNSSDITLQGRIVPRNASSVYKGLSR